MTFSLGSDHFLPSQAVLLLILYFVFIYYLWHNFLEPFLLVSPNSDCSFPLLFDFYLDFIHQKLGNVVVGKAHFINPKALDFVLQI